MRSKFLNFQAVLVTSMVLCLSACKEKKHNESYYYTHTETLKVVLEQCREKQGTLDKFDNKCKVAYRAAMQLTNLSQAFIQSQTDFGQRILRAQIRAADLTLQLQAAKKEQLPVVALEKQLEAEQQKIKNLRAVVGLFIRI